MSKHSTTSAENQSADQNSSIVPAPAKNRNIFRLLFLSMVALGFLMGVTFPMIVKIYFDLERALSFNFTLMCIAAGITVGIANYVLFDTLVSRELSFLVKGMHQANNAIRAALFSNKNHLQHFNIEVKSNDMIGQVTTAFNTMGHTVHQRLRDEANFRNLISDLSANVALDHTAETILKYFINATCMASGLLYGKVDEEMTLLASNGFDTDSKLPQILENWHGPIADTIKSGETTTINTGSECIDWLTMTTPLGSIRPKRIRVIPLIADKKTVGLVVATCSLSDIPEEDQLETLKTYSAYMAPYLHNSLLHNKIQEMASYDSLTHILNRRFGLIRLQEEFSTALRYKTDLSVVLLDIDKFKAINDTYGHETGDYILKTIASTLSLNLRHEEVICRYGGEEFLVIIPRANLEKAAMVAERLRDLVEHHFCHYNNEVITTTISLGVSSTSALTINKENDLINAADTAMYHAKDMGRNRVAIMHNNEPKLFTKESIPTGKKNK